MTDDGLGIYETCSLCGVLDHWSKLRESDAGNVCRECWVGVPA